MADLKQTLIQLNENLSILREREARYAGNAPVELLNQITDHEQAIALTEQARQGQLSEPDWREALRPLLVNIRDRGEQAPETCGVSIGDVDGGIIGSIIAGGDVSNVQVAHGSNIAQASPGGTATVNVTDQRGQQVSGDQYNVAGDQHNYQVEKESPAWRRWSIIVGIVTIIGVIATVLAVPQFNVLVFPEPTVTPTPLPVTPAAEGESLILIATFHETGATHTEPYVKIKRAIEDAAKEVGLDTLRMEIEPTILTADQREEAEALGKLYDAEMVIWGEDTGVQVLVNFYNMKQPDFDAANVRIIEEQRTQIVNPSAYAEFILDDLPGQLTFLAFFAVGQTYFSNEQYGRAINVIEAGITALNDRTRPDGLSEAYFRLGWLYHTLHKAQQSIVQYTKSINLAPLPTTYNNRGNSYADLGNFEQAIEDFNQAIAINPKDFIAYNNRGLSFADLDNPERAIADYNQAIVLNPRFATAYNNRGNSYAALGKLERAIEDYNQAIAINPEYANPYHNRGNKYAAMGDHKQAIADYNQAILLNPRFATAYNNRGNSYAALGNFEQAIEDYNQAIVVNPKDASAFYNRGNSLIALGNHKQAIEDFNQAIALNPGYASAYDNRGISYATLGKPEQAIEDYNQAIVLNPEFATAFNNRGLSYAILGDYKQAIKDYDQAILLNPRFATAYNNRGSSYAALGKPERAIEDYNQAIILNPKDASPYNNRGVSYAAFGNFERAVTDYDQAITLNPNFANPYYNRGLTYSARGKLEQAITDFETGLQFDTDPASRQKAEETLANLKSQLEAQQ